jgi:transposase InsO family protein
METQWIADRAHLRMLLKQQPHRPYRDLALTVGRSVAWVKKWAPRLRPTAASDFTALQRKQSPRQYVQPCRHPQVVERILAIRDQPPDQLQRVPGPKAILHYLHRDPQLQAAQLRLPRSTKTIWHILRDHDRIAVPQRGEHQLVERVAPLRHWQIDFKGSTTVPADPEGKHRHTIEILNVVDVGTSLLVATQPRGDYYAETAIEVLAQLFRDQGQPDVVTFDRDARFVGSSDFPSAFVRFLRCLDIQTDICPAHRPDKNAFVERFHRSLEYECLQVEKPSTEEEVRQAVERYQSHYNLERPNQALTCGNQPPRQAFPQLPTLPQPAAVINPDVWLSDLDGMVYRR